MKNKKMGGGGDLNHCCFLRAWDSGKVQHCRPSLFLKMNKYHLFLNNSEAIVNLLNKVR